MQSWLSLLKRQSRHQTTTTLLRSVWICFSFKVTYVQPPPSEAKTAEELKTGVVVCWRVIYSLVVSATHPGALVAQPMRSSVILIHGNDLGFRLVTRNREADQTNQGLHSPRNKTVRDRNSCILECMWRNWLTWEEHVFEGRHLVDFLLDNKNIVSAEFFSHVHLVMSFRKWRLVQMQSRWPTASLQEGSVSSLVFSHPTQSMIATLQTVAGFGWRAVDFYG